MNEDQLANIWQAQMNSFTRSTSAAHFGPGSKIPATPEPSVDPTRWAAHWSRVARARGWRVQWQRPALGCVRFVFLSSAGVTVTGPALANPRAALIDALALLQPQLTP